MLYRKVDHYLAKIFDVIDIKVPYICHLYIIFFFKKIFILVESYKLYFKHSRGEHHILYLSQICHRYHQ